MDLETRIYLFTGFLESGKTTFINDTVLNTNFCDDETTVVIACEEGEVEFDAKKMKKHNTYVEYVEDMAELSEAYFQFIRDKYHPTQVLVEYNGMWDVPAFMNLKYPEFWDVVQILTTIDASKFTFYVNNTNMRSYLFQHCAQSDLVIFNRIDGQKKSFLRNNLKAMNGRAQIIYELNDGTIDNTMEEELPYDYNATNFDVPDHDFGIFCYDVMEHPERYANKHIRIKGKYIGKDRNRADGFILGRYAMVCCEQDTSLIGLLCKSPEWYDKFMPDEWLIVEGDTTMDYDTDLNMNIITLNVTKIEGTKPLDYEYVTFD